VLVACVSEGKAGQKAVEKVPFFYHDSDVDIIRSRQWPVAEFGEENGKAHVESRSSQKFFAHIMYDKDKEAAERETQLRCRGRDLYKQFLRTVEQRMSANKRPRGPAAEGAATSELDAAAQGLSGSTPPGGHFVGILGLALGGQVAGRKGSESSAFCSTEPMRDAALPASSADAGVARHVPETDSDCSPDTVKSAQLAALEGS
jgi:hypothetical protein